MGSISSTENHQNLTQYETVALDSELNLSDGHPRQDLTEQQRQIVESLSDMWMQSFKHPASTIEREAAEAFFSLFGQKSHLDSHDEIVACYSSSVAMEIFARALSQQGSSIALLHPTFDNIPDILRGNRLNLVAIDEEDCHRQQALSEELLNKVDAVFLTTPNNPTGRYISAVLLDRIARQCAASDTILALDTCFRGFDIRTHYDHYAILRESGCRWVVIEDTGKLWPTLELRPAALLLTSLRVIDSPNPSPIDIVADRTQRHNLLLRDVDYVIFARPALRSHANAPIAKYRDQFRRRVERGAYFCPPYFGMREYAANFRPVDLNEVKPVAGLTIPIGPMSLDLGYHPAGADGCATAPEFFNATVIDGVLDRIPVPARLAGR